MDSHGVLPNGLMNSGQTGSQDRHNITQDIGPINAGAGSRLFVGMNITYEAGGNYPQAQTLKCPESLTFGYQCRKETRS